MIYKDHLFQFVSLLFPSFPRDAGFPLRYRVNSYDHFYNECLKNHTTSPCFLQLYVNDEVDKLWVDADSDSLPQVFNDTRHNYRVLTEKFDVPPHDIILVFTGMKGYHLYIRNTITPFEYVEDDELGYYCKTKLDLNMVLSYITRETTTPDAPLFGDTNRTVRAAGVQRPEKTFAVALDPEIIFADETSQYHTYFKEKEFHWPTIFKETTKFLSERYESGYHVKNNRTARNHFKNIFAHLNDANWKLPAERTKVLLDKRLKKKAVSIADMNGREGFGKAVDITLKTVLSEDTYLGVHLPNPSHAIRRRFALALLYQDFTVDDIVDFAASLGWIDYNPLKTRFHAEDIKRRYL